MKKTRFWAIAMATFLTIGFVGCKGDKDEDIPYTGNTLKNGESIEIEDLGVDKDATYPLHFKLTLKNGYLYAENLFSKATEEAINNGMFDADFLTLASLSDCGEKAGLSEITAYPLSGYLDSVPATEKHGYVLKAVGNGKVDTYQNPLFHDPVTQYMRIWLEEATDDGFKLRYEWPWIQTVE